MKKSRIVPLAALAIVALSVSSASAYSNVNKGCTACHTASFLHGNDGMSSIACTSCHVNPAGDTSVTPAKCIACHPHGSPGLCSLVKISNHSSAGCGSCHGSCYPDPVTTTVHSTSSTSTTTTTIGICPAQQVLGDDSEDLEKLRAFRDGPLARSVLGRRIVQVYYDNAEKVTAALESSPSLKATARKMLQLAIAAIRPGAAER